MSRFFLFAAALLAVTLPPSVGSSMTTSVPHSGLTELRAPENNSLKPLAPKSKLIRTTAKSSLKRIHPKSHPVRNQPNPQLIRVRIKAAETIIPPQPDFLKYAHATGVKSRIPRQGLDELLALLNKDIYQITKTESASHLLHQTKRKIEHHSVQALEKLSALFQ